MSPKGHEVFNTVQLNSILNLGCEIRLVVCGNFLNNSKANEKIRITRIPETLEQHEVSALTVRLRDIRRLLWIKNNINIKSYDKVIFSSYDILSLFFFRSRYPIYLINHNNVDQFDSRIKLFLTKHLPSNFKHIALNEYMMDKLKIVLPGKIVEYVPHGYLEPTTRDKRPSCLKEGEKFIFCPVNRNYDLSLMDAVLKSEILDTYLKEMNIKLFIKKQLANDSMLSNIQVIGMLDDEEYNYMLSKAVAVLLPYGKDFRYRCSGILFECIARQTPIIATPREALKIYKDKIDIHFFSNVNDFIGAMNYALERRPTKYDIGCYKPDLYWKRILIDKNDGIKRS